MLLTNVTIVSYIYIYKYKNNMEVIDNDTSINTFIIIFVCFIIIICYSNSIKNAIQFQIIKTHFHI